MQLEGAPVALDPTGDPLQEPHQVPAVPTLPADHITTAGHCRYNLQHPLPKRRESGETSAGGYGESLQWLLEGFQVWKTSVQVAKT